MSHHARKFTIVLKKTLANPSNKEVNMKYLLIFILMLLPISYVSYVSFRPHHISTTSAVVRFEDSFDKDLRKAIETEKPWILIVSIDR